MLVWCKPSLWQPLGVFRNTAWPLDVTQNAISALRLMTRFVLLLSHFITNDSMICPVLKMSPMRGANTLQGLGQKRQMRHSNVNHSDMSFSIAA